MHISFERPFTLHIHHAYTFLKGIFLCYLFNIHTHYWKVFFYATYPTYIYTIERKFFMLHIYTLLKGIFYATYPTYIHTIERYFSHATYPTYILYWKVLFFFYLFFIYTYILKSIFIPSRCRVFTMMQPARMLVQSSQACPHIHVIQYIFSHPRQTKLRSLSLSHVFWHFILASINCPHIQNGSSICTNSFHKPNFTKPHATKHMAGACWNIKNEERWQCDMPIHLRTQNRPMAIPYSLPIQANNHGFTYELLHKFCKK